MIDFKWFIPDYFDKFKLQVLADMKASGATAAQTKAKMTEMNGAVEMYKNPLFNALFYLHGNRAGGYSNFGNRGADLKKKGY